MSARNVEYVVDGDSLIIRVRMGERIGPSASGKTTLVASTQGTMKVKGTEVRFNLTAYVPKDLEGTTAG